MRLVQDDSRAPAAPRTGALAVARDVETEVLLTAAQLADRWQVPVRTIYAWARRNEIPHYRAGRLLRFHPDEIAAHCRRTGFVSKVVPDQDHPGESAFDLLTA